MISLIIAAASAKPGYLAPVVHAPVPVVAAVPAPLPAAVSHSTFVRHPSPVIIKHHAPLVTVPVVHPVQPIHPIAPAPLFVKSAPLVPVHHPSPFFVKTVPVVPAVHPAPLIVKPHFVPAVHPAPLIIH